jgi:hypothetical protein
MLFILFVIWGSVGPLMLDNHGNIIVFIKLSVDRMFGLYKLVLDFIKKGLNVIGGCTELNDLSFFH